jgi:HAD superfamily hydrolase (TIGR01509 family)
MSVETDVVSDARSLLTGVRGVLFDFDGPVCRLFPGDSSRPVADELRALVSRAGADSLLTEEEERVKDPHAVLRAVHRERRDDADLVGALEKTVTEGELYAARREPDLTPGVDRLIRELVGRGLRLAVVTNNSARAASYYLRSKGLLGCFAAVHGRTRDIDRMKPDPDVVNRALHSLGLRSHEAVMIGDSPADVGAAEKAGVGFIGYGRDDRKESELRRVGAELVLNSYACLLDEE